MKKIIPLLCLVSLLATAAQAAVTIAADFGYLLDSEEEYLSARIGFPVREAGSFSHQLELEVGYTDTRAGGIKADLLPVTVNYRFNAVTHGAWGYTVGAGAGFARARVDGVSIGGPVRLRDESFAAQAFAGVTYQVSPVMSVSVGAKYIWVDDVRFAGTSVKIGDDLALTAGLTFRF